MTHYVAVDDPHFTPLESCLTCGTWMDPKQNRRHRSLQEVAGAISILCTPTAMVYKWVMRLADEEKALHCKAHKEGNQEACVCVPQAEGGLQGVSGLILAGQHLSPTCHLSRRCFVCESCSNWLRRLFARKPHVPQPAIGWKHRTLMPMDEFLLFAVHPGHFRMPDKRTMFRMLRCLSLTSDTGAPNPYKAFAAPYFHTSDLTAEADHLLLHSREELTANEAALQVIVTEWFAYNGSPLAMSNAETSKMVRDSFDLKEFIRNLPQSPPPMVRPSPPLVHFESCHPPLYMVRSQSSVT